MNHPTVDLVFDGQCGFCTRSVNWIKRLDRHARINVHPAQRLGVREQFGLTEADTQNAAWVFSNGRRTAGAAAINLALDAALGVRFFSVLHRLPGLHWAQERTYHWISAHRYLLRGVTPWCTAHPEDCELAIEGATCTRPIGGGDAPSCSG
ncbi:DUF393 domain-containing protein [Stomatohabitans albus]|uniref:thiol-disulfide oxidoreductase DCC family protein n=1 Tax=Stomatohabitans albus TaxID=3110766 RepID=UPI00300D67E4